MSTITMDDFDDDEAGPLDDDFDDCDDERGDSLLGEFILGGCGYPDCAMPGPHYTSECHNGKDLEQYEKGNS